MSPRRRIDPVHFVLAPICFLLALPLLWMLVSSFMSNAQINRFPPTIIPGSLHLDGYKNLFADGAPGTWFWNSTIVSAVCVVPTSCSAPRPATRSHGWTSAAPACCSRR